MYYADYELFNTRRYLEDKKIILYGAGNCGRRTGEMLRDMGYEDYIFCDQDSGKWGTELEGHPIYSLSEIAKREFTGRTIFVIAIESEQIQSEIEKQLGSIGDIILISLFSLTCYGHYMSENYCGQTAYFEIMSRHYRSVSERFNELCTPNEIILYQKGKVGSTSVERGLQEQGVRYLKCHYLFFRQTMFEAIAFGENTYFYTDIYKQTRYIQQVRSLFRGKKIITMVRDPIARVLSNMFQIMTADKSHTIEWFFSREMRNGNTFNEIIIKYIETAIEENADLFEWFDEELKQACGVNIYEFPFDREQGYGIIHGPECDILCVKMEKLDELNPIIGNFTGVKDFKIKRDNIGYEKRYRYFYQETLRRIAIPEQILDYYYRDNPKMQHFYTRQECDTFFRRWSLK